MILFLQLYSVFLLLHDGRGDIINCLIHVCFPFFLSSYKSQFSLGSKKLHTLYFVLIKHLYLPGFKSNEVLLLVRNCFYGYQHIVYKAVVYQRDLFDTGEFKDGKKTFSLSRPPAVTGICRTYCPKLSFLALWNVGTLYSIKNWEQIAHFQMQA